MFPIEAFQATLEKFASILRPRQIPFHLTGGVTSVAYAEPRMTQDIDIVVNNESLSKNLEEVISELSNADFMLDEATIRTAVVNHKMFQLLDLAESLKLDIYARELVEGELTRSTTIELFDGVHYPIASRTDTAIAKLLWSDKGSHKSRRDLRHLYTNGSRQQQRDIDTKAQELNKQDLLKEILAESDEIDL